MQRKLMIAIVVLLFCFAGTILVLEFIQSNPTEQRETNTNSPAGSPEKKETTIRNVTNTTLTYHVKPTDSEQEPEQKILEVGAIDRYPGDTDLDVIFEKEGEKLTYTIDAGMPYSFRPDEKENLDLWDGSHGREDAVDLAPYVPTPMDVVEKMLKMANVDKDDVLYDLGCGDGRIIITAAEKFGSRGVGIDIVPERIRESREGAKKAGIEKLVQFRLQDATRVDFSEATVVTLYLLPESNELLRPQLEKQLRAGSYVVSHGYKIPGWEKKLVESATIEDKNGETHSVYSYIK